MATIEYEVDSNGCFNCTSHTQNHAGYSNMTNNGIQYKVHRYIYEECFGAIKDGLVVRHKCDNRRCINPEHLELGTHEDNVRDRVERNRSASGVNNGRSKLTEEDVRHILISLRDKSSTIAALSIRFSVDPKTIQKIRNKKMWAHVEV